MNANTLDDRCEKDQNTLNRFHYLIRNILEHINSVCYSLINKSDI